MLLGQYQQFQGSADSLKAWLQTCEASVEKLLSDTVASDPGVLQQQLATTKVSLDPAEWCQGLVLHDLKCPPKQVLAQIKGDSWDVLV